MTDALWALTSYYTGEEDHCPPHHALWSLNDWEREAGGGDINVLLLFLTEGLHIPRAMVAALADRERCPSLAMALCLLQGHRELATRLRDVGGAAGPSPCLCCLPSSAAAAAADGAGSVQHAQTVSSSSSQSFKSEPQAF